MRKTKEMRGRLLRGMLAFLVAIGIFAVGFYGTSLTGYAAAQAKVTAPNGAKIRQDADTGSTMVGGAEKDKVLTVLGQKQGADGYTWYQVQVNDTTTGYVRADLVEVTGDIPSGGAGEGQGTEGGETAPPVDVTQVNPISATVLVESAEIRDTPSQAGQVAGTVPGETVVTVTGYVTDAEGAVWYQVNYISGETQVNGFLISDSCQPSGELTLPGQEPVQDPEPEPEPEPARYEVVERNGDWLLVDNVKNPGNGYSIEQLFSGIDNNAQMYRDSEAKVKNQKIIIIVLVFLLVAAVAGIAFLVFKVREMMDSAYFNEVENETLRRKNASGGSGKQNPPMHTVGPKEQSNRSSGARPGTTQRPAGSAGQRPTSSASQRGAGVEQRPGSTQGQRTAARSAGTRPAGTAQGARPTGQGSRPAGTMQGARPSGTMPGSRPSGGVQGQGSRPAGAVPGSRYAGSVQGQRPVGAQGARRTEGTQAKAPQGARPVQNTQKAQPKNFLSDDDEFEFEFLNYDGEEEDRSR